MKPVTSSGFARRGLDTLRTSRRKAQAFTLVEAMVAAVLLGTVIASCVFVLRMGFSLVETARDQTVASQLLQSEMETLRLHNWDELILLPAKEAFQVNSTFDDNIAQRFHCVRIIEDVRPGVLIKRVVLQATWKTSNGVERELTYKTRIAKDGINDYYYRSL